MLSDYQITYQVILPSCPYQRRHNVHSFLKRHQRCMSHRRLLSSAVHCYLLLSHVVSCCPSIVIHCCSLLSSCPLLSIVLIHCRSHRLPLDGAAIATFWTLLRVFWLNHSCVLRQCLVSHTIWILLQFWICSHHACFCTNRLKSYKWIGLGRVWYGILWMHVWNALRCYNYFSKIRLPNHRLPLTCLNASVYTGFNAQKL